MGERAQQQDDVVAGDAARRGQLTQPGRQEAGLGDAFLWSAVIDGRLQLDSLGIPAVGLGQQQLDRLSAPARLVLRRGGAHGERLEAVQHRGADRVGRCDHFGPRAEVAAQRQDPRPVGAREAIALFAEDVEVGVAESVDRLELVADQEDLGRWPAQRLDQAQLQPVGVLKLVDHQL